jgi:hypothetical protein
MKQFVPDHTTADTVEPDALQPAYYSDVVGKTHTSVPKVHLSDSEQDDIEILDVYDPMPFAFTLPPDLVEDPVEGEGSGATGRGRKQQAPAGPKMVKKTTKRRRALREMPLVEGLAFPTDTFTYCSPPYYFHPIPCFLQGSTGG